MSVGNDAPKLDRGKSGQVLQGRLRAAALRTATIITDEF
jgi:hypothetical protein